MISEAAFQSLVYDLCAEATLTALDAIDAARDVSLTESWLDCAPHEEKVELRLRNAERVINLRELFYTRNMNQNCRVFNYKPTKCTLDVLHQNRNARSLKPAGSFNNIRIHVTDIVPEFPTEVTEVKVLEVIVPEVLVSECPSEVTPGDQSARNKKQKKKGKMRRFFCCVRK